MKTHRQLYPKQYSHQMVGRFVQVRGEGRVFEVRRVITSPRFGELVMGPPPTDGGEQMYYLLAECRVVEEIRYDH